MQSEAEMCLVLKGRIQTLIEWQNKYLHAFKITMAEQPDYLPSSVDMGTITEKLGSVPTDIKQLMNYIKDATSIYMENMNLYEDLRDNHKDYVTEKKFLYECESVQ